MARAEGPRRAVRALALAAALVGALVASLCVGLATPTSVWAKEAELASADPVLEARVMRIAAELRCLVCQNQTIADSHADLAVDLRNQVREMLRRGQSDTEVYDYMIARYGDFVLYRPRLMGTTAVLWFGPALLLVGGAAVLWITLRRRSRMNADRFEADLDDEPPPPPDARPSA